MLIQDADIRHQALDPTQSFIVQAPAGSGKTELLTQRYLVLLANAEIAPEEVVAITFTRKASAEMRARILQALEFGEKTAPDENDYRYTTWSLARAVLQKDHECQWNLMRNPNRLRIMTIDALSAFLCRHAPILSTIGAPPVLCEDRETPTLYELAAEKLLITLIQDERYRQHIEYLLLHVDNHIETLKKLLVELLSKREQWLPHVMQCANAKSDIKIYLENSLENVVVEKLGLVASRIPPELKQSLVLLARHAGEKLKNSDAQYHPIMDCADFLYEDKPDITVFSAWFGLANLLLTDQGEWRKRIDKSIGFPSGDSQKPLMQTMLQSLADHDALKEALYDLSICPPTTYSQKQWETLTALTEVLPLLSPYLSAVFEEKGCIDFVEVNLSALKALGTREQPTDLSFYLDYPIRHLLIDEFQDTSLTQLQLIEKLTAEWMTGDGRTLFVVGDPMQSIYRFRNAEVGLFLRAQQIGIGTLVLTPLTLTMNFRSQAQLVDWFNESFQIIFPSQADIATGRVAYTKAVAARAQGCGGVQFYPLLSNNEDEESDWMIEQIKTIHRNHPTETIAILVRARAQLTRIIQQLPDHHIPFCAVDIDVLVNRREIQDLLTLTRALLHRGDRIAWLSLLRAPWCGMILDDLEKIATAASTQTIWEIILHAENKVVLSDQGLRHLQRVRDCIAHAFAKKTAFSLSEWIEGVWILLGGPATLKQPSELNNARTYFQLIEKMQVQDSLFSVEQLNAHCRKLYANNQDENAQNPVQIMTIHKSKGLEFDHVFLPGLNRGSANHSSLLLRWLDRPNARGGEDLLLAPMKSIDTKKDVIYDYLKAIENQKLQHETTRLLYVAITRAKKSLYLTAQLEKDDNKKTIKKPAKNSLFDKLWPLYEKIVLNHFEAFSKKDFINTVGEKQITDERLSDQWQLPAVFKKQYSSMDAKPILIDIHLSPLFSRVIGIVIHEILQRMAEKSLNDFYFSLPQWQSRLHSLGLLPHEMQAASDLIQTMMSRIFSDEKAQWILSPHQDARCEWALVDAQTFDCDHLIIDRTFIDAEGSRWIIDYKTTAPENAQTHTDFLAAQKIAHQEQLEKYAGILAKMDDRRIKLGLYFPLCGAWVEWCVG